MIGTYNHLPEGLDDLEFEKIYQACYRPFLSALNKFPGIQATLHYSGGLLRRIETIHPEYLMVLEEMSSRRQIELLGGGFYSPILPLIPNSDRLGQIEQMTTFMRKHFGRRPRGCWLAEYAWEPWLASTLQTSGMDYTFLSERQFIDASGDPSSAHSPAITEDLGRCVTVLPVIDCGNGPENAEDLSKSLERAEGRAFAALMLPGDRIRDLWNASGLESPDLYMEREFSAISRRALEFDMTTPSRYLKACKPDARLYFPGSASERFISASGTPGKTEAKACVRRAIIRSASASSLHARMMHVHLVIGQLRGDKARKKAAIEELWKAQCGDAYWSARGWGIESPGVREAAYRSLIEAELTTRRKGSFATGILRTDMDFDGLKEYIFRGNELNAYVHPRGAALVELDALKARRNLSNLYVDSQDAGTARRACFVDRLYADDPGPGIANAPWAGDLAYFSGHLYDETVPGVEPPSIAFSRDGMVELGGSNRPLSMVKRFVFARKAVHVSYELRNSSSQPLRAWLAVENNLTLGPESGVTIHVDGREVEGGSSGFHVGSASRLSLHGTGPLAAASIACAAPAAIGLAAIGVDVRQGFAMTAAWGLQLAPDESWKNEIVLSIQE